MFLRTRRDFFQRSQRLPPVFIGKAVAGRIVRRRVQNHEHLILARRDRFHMLREIVLIPLQIIGKQAEGTKFATVVIAKHAVRAPVPVAGQHFIAPFGVIMNGVVNAAGAAGRGHRRNLRRGSVRAETTILHFGKKIRQTRDRRVLNHITHRKAAVYFLYCRQTHQIFILV